MKKKKVSLAILGVASLFATTFASAETKTFWQCMPMTCSQGQYLNGTKCVTCDSDEWCPDGKIHERFGDDGVKNHIVNQYNLLLLNECIKYASEKVDTFILNDGYGNGNYIFDIIKNLAFTITYNGKFSRTTSSQYLHSAGSTVFTINCLQDIPNFAKKAIIPINETLAKGELSKAHKNKKLSTFTDKDTIDELKYIRNAGFGAGDASPLSTGEGILDPGLYAVVLEGGGGGGGGAGSTAQDSGDGGWGQAKMGHFLILEKTPYTATIGASGHGGEGKDSGCDGGDGGRGGDTTFKIADLKFTALGGYGGVGTNSYEDGHRGNAGKREDVTFSGNCSGGRRDGSQSDVRQPGCGDDWNAWGSGGGPGRIRIYKLES